MFKQISKNKKLNLLITTFQESSVGFTIIDVSLVHNPIVHVNSGFIHQTGYSPEMLIDNNLEMLYGIKTDLEAITTIQDAFVRNIYVSVEILNYRKDGSTYWNELILDPFYVEEENKYYFICFHRDITEKMVNKEPVLSHN